MRATHERRPGRNGITESVVVFKDDSAIHPSISWASRSLDESLAMKTLINMHQGDPWRLRELARYLSDVAFYSGIEWGQAHPEDDGEDD